VYGGQCFSFQYSDVYDYRARVTPGPGSSRLGWSIQCMFEHKVSLKMKGDDPAGASSSGISLVEEEEWCTFRLLCPMDFSSVPYERDDDKVWGECL